MSHHSIGFWKDLVYSSASIMTDEGIMTNTPHENYELLNLIGYGLAKFDMGFVRKFGFHTKTAFYENIVSIGIADTAGTVKNRQDLFDPFFVNKRKGWWQKGNAYLHRKTFIDSLFGSYELEEYADAVKITLQINLQ